jgi:hypothetical protein
MIFASLLCGMVSASWAYDYQLYKNRENIGIVVFPKKFIYPELEKYILSQAFDSTESGKAVMRSGSKRENETFMMPLETQKKHGITRFIVLQVLEDHNLLVGIFEPEWGLTLPSSIFSLQDVKEKIPQTLNIFRGNNRQKQTQRLESNGLRPVSNLNNGAKKNTSLSNYQ